MTNTTVKAKRITYDGRIKFSSELEYLRNVKLKDLATNLRELYSDRYDPDDAQIANARLEIAMTTARIQSLKNLISDSDIVNPSSKKDEVDLGSIVTVQEKGNQPVTYTIVSSAEADSVNGYVSEESPLGKAILGKRVGDVGIVTAPKGDWQIKILSVS